MKLKVPKNLHKFISLLGILEDVNKLRVKKEFSKSKKTLNEIEKLLLKELARIDITQ